MASGSAVPITAKASLFGQLSYVPPLLEYHQFMFGVAWGRCRRRNSLCARLKLCVVVMVTSSLVLTLIP